MITSILTGIGLAFLGKCGYSMQKQHKINNVNMKKLLENSYDLDKKLEIRTGYFNGSNNIFSLKHPNALYNQINIYKYKYKNNSLNVLLFLTTQIPITEVIKEKENMYATVLCSENLTLCDKPIDLNKIKVEYKEICSKLTTIDCNIIKEKFNININITEDTYIKEKLLLNDTIMHCVIKNNNIEYINSNRDSLEKYLLKYYPLADGYLGELILIAIIVAMVILSIIIFEI